MVDVYRIAAKLGEGARGYVYRAVHSHIGGDVALKVLRRELVPRPDVVERFVREAKLVNDIRHPNIVNIFGMGALADGRPYYVMEYLEGQSLELDLEGRPWVPIAEVVAILRPIARALDAAKLRGVLHHALRATDIFVLRDQDDGSFPRVKLLDFGVATQAALPPSPLVGTTSGAWPLDKLPSISPERLRGAAASEREDVYSLGAIAYRMLVGMDPWLDGALPSSAAEQRTLPRRIREPREGNPQLPLQVALVLRRALEPEPTRRFDQACQLIDALEDAGGGAPRRDGGLRPSWTNLPALPATVAPAMGPVDTDPESTPVDDTAAMTQTLDVSTAATLPAMDIAGDDVATQVHSTSEVYDAVPPEAMAELEAAELRGGSVSSIEIDVPPAPAAAAAPPMSVAPTREPSRPLRPTYQALPSNVPRSPWTWAAVWLAAGAGGMLVAYLWPSGAPAPTPKPQAAAAAPARPRASTRGDAEGPRATPPPSAKGRMREGAGAHGPPSR
jgi:serine/threonine-protein kinase